MAVSNDVVKNSVVVTSMYDVIVVVVPLKVNSASTGYEETNVFVPVEMETSELYPAFSVTVTVVVKGIQVPAEALASVMVTKLVIVDVVVGLVVIVVVFVA